jgi:hypothetical protein
MTMCLGGGLQALVLQSFPSDTGVRGGAFRIDFPVLAFWYRFSKDWLKEIGFHGRAFNEFLEFIGSRGFAFRDLRFRISFRVFWFSEILLLRICFRRRTPQDR